MKQANHGAIDNQQLISIIERIEKLTDEQFELLITLYSQQERESVPISPVEHPSFLRPSL